MTAINEIDFLSVREVAAILGLSKSLVYREIQQGNLPCHQFGARCYRVARSELIRYQEEHMMTAVSNQLPTKTHRARVTGPSILRHVRLNRSPVEQT